MVQAPKGMVTVGQQTSFIIQARNSNDLNIKSGGDVFNVACDGAGELLDLLVRTVGALTSVFPRLTCMLDGAGEGPKQWAVPRLLHASRVRHLQVPRDAQRRAHWQLARADRRHEEKLDPLADAFVNGLFLSRGPCRACI